MTVYIKPSLARGEITAPPSKSVAHRALICAALSSGSTVSNISFSDDIKATTNALISLGANAEVAGNRVNIGGLITKKVERAEINAKESGSTLRFLLPLALIFGTEVKFYGAKRLFERDFSVYENIAKEQGIHFVKETDSITVFGKLKSGVFKFRGDISSQFVSGLMFALPLLSGDSVIEFTTKVESKPYIDLTVNILSRFGIKIEERGNGYLISGGQAYKRQDITIEGDYSNAAFLDAFNLLGGTVTVNGLLENSVQGDRIYKEYFNKLKSGGEYNLSDCPDLAPVLFALAAYFKGGKFTGTARLKIKESDRALAMASELSKFGAKVTVSDNEVIIVKTKLHAPKVPLSSYGDHRIAMALSLLLSRYGGEISGAEAASKSYPEFFCDIKKLGIEVEIK